MKFLQITLLLLSLTLLCCRAPWIATYNTHSTNKIHIADTAIYNPADSLLEPYRLSLTRIMADTITYASGLFKKKVPAGSLGNLVTDAIWHYYQNHSIAIDAVITNYGGLRLQEWPAGAITLAKVYELLPFDNEVVLITISKDLLRTWIKHISNAKGWPIAGMNIQINPSDNTADSIKIEWLKGNVENVSQESVRIATIDYVANGGDRCDFLKGVPQLPSKQLVRDIVLEYLRTQKKIVPDSSIRFIIHHE